LSVVSGQSMLLDIDELAEQDVDTDNDVFADAFISADLYFELGQWLAGLESFCTLGRAMFLGNRESLPVDRKYLAEFSICRAILLRCAELSRALRADKTTDPEFTRSRLHEVERFIPDALVLNSAIARSPESGGQEWAAWCHALTDRLVRLQIVKDFGREFLHAGEYALPTGVQKLLEAGKFSEEDQRDLKRFLPRLGGVLKSLSIVRRMLDVDLPIRPSIAIFAYVIEATNELVGDINRRLSVHPDESSEMFAMLDAASYMLSIECKKIVSQELVPVIEVRSAITAFAHVESAHAVLNDNIRQLLAGFAQMHDPKVETDELFPDFQNKLEESIELRARLWIILQKVRGAEQATEMSTLDELRGELRGFLDAPASFLFYKDRETFERFCNEIELTNSIEDAGPIVHRFSAYVETLFSLVQMRAVLANHPMPAQ
jgi:hypothetical protein